MNKKTNDGKRKVGKEIILNSCILFASNKHCTNLKARKKLSGSKFLPSMSYGTELIPYSKVSTQAHECRLNTVRNDEEKN